MSFICNLLVDGKPCGLTFGSRRKLKEHLAPAPHRALRVVCPFCNDKEITFNRSSDLKNHVVKRHKEALDSVHVPAEELLSDNNCFWLAYYPEHYRFLVEPSDRNTRASSRLRSLLLEWTRRISSALGPKARRSRNDWLEGWEKTATDFRVPSKSLDPPKEYNPSSPGMYSIFSISLSPGNIIVILEDSDHYFRLHLDDKILYDPKSITSISRKMAVLRDSPALGATTFVSLDQEKWKRQAQHYASSLGIESSYIESVARCSKSSLPEPEIELFAESDLESSPVPSSARKVVERTPSPAIALDPEPARKRIKLNDEPSVKSFAPVSPLPASPPHVSVDHVASNPPAVVSPAAVPPTAVSTAVVSPPASTQSHPVSSSSTLGPLAARARVLLARGCMPLLPPARRQWDKEEAVTLTSGSVSILWPPKGYSSMSKDKRLLELEFAALSLKRSRPGGFDVERASLLDEFNFMALPGTLCLSPRKLSPPSMKSRVYLYQSIRNIALGHASSEEDEAVVNFLESGQRRMNLWDYLINVIDNAGIPLRLID